VVSPSLELFKNCGDAALGDVVGDGLGLQLVVLEVFSNLYNSVPVMIPSFASSPHASAAGVSHVLFAPFCPIIQDSIHSSSSRPLNLMSLPCAGIPDHL